MFFIFTAVYAEAKPIIEYYKMHKLLQENKFQMFVSDEAAVAAVVAGVGKTAAAACVSRIISLYGNNTAGILNMGVCGKTSGKATEDTGRAYICNKIEDFECGRIFYPDMLIRHNFIESEIVTVPVVADNRYLEKSGLKDRNVLVDMEAAAVYQAGNYYIGPEKLHFIKIVSDFGTDKKITPEYVSELVYKNILPIAGYIDKCKIVYEPAVIESKKTEQDILADRLCEDLKCSATMQNELKHIFTYCKLSGTDCMGFWKQLYDEEKLPCTSKREGKVYIDEFMHRLFE
jgi:hypothetical protein